MCNTWPKVCGRFLGVWNRKETKTNCWHKSGSFITNCNYSSSSSSTVQAIKSKPIIDLILINNYSGRKLIVDKNWENFYDSKLNIFDIEAETLGNYDQHFTDNLSFSCSSSEKWRLHVSRFVRLTVYSHWRLGLLSHLRSWNQFSLDLNLVWIKTHQIIQ